VDVTGTNLIIGGNGALGRELAKQLLAAGKPVMIASRSGTTGIPRALAAMCDASDPRQIRKLAAAAQTCFVTVGVDYTKFAQLWPPLIDGLIEGLTDTGVPLIFADNLYMYGPQQSALREDLPLADYGVKPRIRAFVAGRLESAWREGRILMAMVRASDFYGPGADQHGLIDGFIIQPALEGKPARVMCSLNQPHTFTYLPDYARALISVAEEESAWGEAWHVPNAPPLTLGELISQIEDLTRQKITVQVARSWLITAAGMFNPVMREMKEMQFQWNAPYLVDHSRFAAKFWDNFTPLDEGLQASIDWARRKQ